MLPASSPKNRRRRLPITLAGLTIAVITFATLSLIQANSSASIAPTSYDPAAYGLPDTIAGYSVLAVLTSENTACMPPGKRELIVQSTQNFNTFFQGNPLAVRQELEQIVGDEALHWGIQYVGPGTTKESVFAGQARWNAHFEEGGCVRFGPIEGINQGN